jgi:hypothetical protein
MKGVTASMTSLVGGFMVVMGLAIALTWARDIRSSPEIDRSAGLVRARDRRDGSLFLPHWIAEYATAIGLVVGGLGLILDRGWGKDLSLIALGGLTYTSVNSLGWTLALPSRRPYAIPMLVGAVGGVVSVVVLLAS